MKSYPWLLRQQHLYRGNLSHGAKPLDNERRRRRQSHVAPNRWKGWLAAAPQDMELPMETFVEMYGQ